jgi:hypothetical protein
MLWTISKATCRVPPTDEAIEPATEAWAKYLATGTLTAAAQRQRSTRPKFRESARKKNLPRRDEPEHGRCLLSLGKEMPHADSVARHPMAEAFLAAMPGGTASSALPQALT